MMVPSGIKIHLTTEVSSDDFRTQTIYSVPRRILTSPPDASTVDQMNAVEASGTLSFWDDPEEDRYSENDGDDT